MENPSKTESETPKEQTVPLTPAQNYRLQMVNEVIKMATSFYQVTLVGGVEGVQGSPGTITAYPNENIVISKPEEKKEPEKAPESGK